MSLKNMSVLVEPVVSFTNGESLAFVADGVAVLNGRHLTEDNAAASFTVRKSIVFKHRQASMDQKRQWNREKKSITISFPRTLAVTGEIVYDTIYIERNMHPTYTNEQQRELNSAAAYILFGAEGDATSFFSVGSLE